MGFKDFCNNQNIGEQTNTKNVEELYNKYKDKSENELLDELLKNVSQQKQNGTYNYSNILSMVQNIMPYLNEHQKQKIQEILSKIN